MYIYIYIYNNKYYRLFTPWPRERIIINEVLCNNFSALYQTNRQSDYI